MNNLKGIFWGAATTGFLLLGLLISAGSAHAQTKKKKTTRKTTTTTSSVPQPVAQQTMPVIVSQADQYQDQNSQIISGNVQTTTETTTEAQPETFDEKLDKISSRIKEMNTRMKSLESSKQSEYDEKQKRLLLNLDILTRAEQRAESLRKQLFELIEKQNSFQTKLETIDYELRPEMIERQTNLVGSLRPEEIREMKKKNLEAEKRNLNNLLLDMQATRTNLEQNVQKADQLVEKLRAVLEKDIDNALTEQPKDQ